jgi:hypothetical protein
MTEQRIIYKKVRDFGQVFGASFGFIKQNFKPLYGSLLFFAGPFLLIVATVSAISFGSSFAVNRMVKGGFEEFYETFLIPYITIIGVSLIGMTVFNVVLNKNVIENENLQENEKLTVGHSMKNLWTDFTRILLNNILLGITVIGSVFIIVIIFGGIISVMAEGGGSGGAIGLAILLVILLLIGLLILGPILSFVPMAAVFVCQRDRIGIFPAIGKVIRYMKGNFWITWAVSFVGLLTYSTMGSLVQAPAMILNLISTFSRMKDLDYQSSMDASTPVPVIVVTAICALLSYGVLVIYHLIAIYQYTNLEEKKEGQSILEKINQIQ